MSDKKQDKKPAEKVEVTMKKDQPVSGLGTLKKGKSYKVKTSIAKMLVENLKVAE